MSTRGKVRLFILFAFLLYCAIASVVDAGGEWSFYAPAWQPHDSTLIGVWNRHPFDTYEFLVTVYDGDFQFVTSVYVQVPPDTLWVEEDISWCSEVGGVAKVTFERLDLEATNEFDALASFHDPCDGEGFFRVFLPILGT